MTQNNMFQTIFLIATAFPLIALAQPSPKTVIFKGDVYAWKDGARGELSFRQTRTEKTSGDTFTVDTLFTDLSGKPAVTEHLEILKGKPVSHEFNQLQTDESGKTEIKDGKVHYSYRKQGKTSEETTSLPDRYVFPPSFLTFVYQHWDAFLKGDSISMRFGVVERLEDFGFKFFKVSEQINAGGTTWETKLKPTSFIIAAVVDPVEFTIALGSGDQERRMIRVKGRLPVKIKDGNKWSDFVGEIIYDSK